MKKHQELQKQSPRGVLVKKVFGLQVATSRVTNIRQLRRMTSSYLGKLCVHVLKLIFLKCNEDALSLFKNTYNEEKGSFF